eukprot:6474479-Amphidinium_carterae.1
MINYPGSTTGYPSQYETGYLGQTTTTSDSTHATLVLDDHYKDTNSHHITTLTTFLYNNYEQKIHRLFLQLMKNPHRSTGYDICEYSDIWFRYDHKEQHEVGVSNLEIQGCNGCLCNGRVNVRLHYIGHRLYINAAIVKGYYRNVDYTEEFANWYSEWYDDFKEENMVYRIGSDDDPNILIYGDYILHNEDEQTKQETSKPKTLQQPYKPITRKMTKHNLTHTYPAVIGCEICVKGKSRQQYHKKRGLKQQSVTQIDYAFIRGENDHYKATVPTMCQDYQERTVDHRATQRGDEADTTSQMSTISTPLTPITRDSRKVPLAIFCTIEDYRVSVLQRLQCGQPEHQLP